MGEGYVCERCGGWVSCYADHDCSYDDSGDAVKRLRAEIESVRSERDYLSAQLQTGREEIERLRETNRRLNHRAIAAEAGVRDAMRGVPYPRNFGRMLANAGYEIVERENAALKAERDALARKVHLVTREARVLRNIVQQDHPDEIQQVAGIREWANRCRRGQRTAEKECDALAEKVAAMARWMEDYEPMCGVCDEGCVHKDTSECAMTRRKALLKGKGD